MPVRYIWMTWAGVHLLTWLIIYLSTPNLRSVQWRVGICTAPFGFTEPLFIGRYWDPPSVLGLTHRIHADLESFVFCFSIGGIASVLYNFVALQPVRIPLKTAVDLQRLRWRVLAFIVPPACYLPLLLAINRPLLPGVIVMLVGALLRFFRLHPLRAKMLIGGVLFCGYYALALAMLPLLSPGYVARVWAHDLPFGSVGIFPVLELLFGLSFGLFWSGIYEDFCWTFVA